ncbi:MAG: hypothetical protein KDD60_09685 [Bdellovibrionales bacterium]|nr:hypothetical protein [Bdellovibrionales bacterium]
MGQGIQGDQAFVEKLKNNPQKQLDFLNSIFNENWDEPETILLAVNQVAEAQGRAEKLHSSDLQDIVRFAKDLGFEPVLTSGGKVEL